MCVIIMAVEKIIKRQEKITVSGGGKAGERKSKRRMRKRWVQHGRREGRKDGGREGMPRRQSEPRGGRLDHLSPGEVLRGYVREGTAVQRPLTHGKIRRR